MGGVANFVKRHWLKIAVLLIALTIVVISFGKYNRFKR